MLGIEFMLSQFERPATGLLGQLVLTLFVVKCSQAIERESQTLASILQLMVIETVGVWTPLHDSIMLIDYALTILPYPLLEYSLFIFSCFPLAFFSSCVQAPYHA